jgi:hypothetical protein
MKLSVRVVDRFKIYPPWACCFLIGFRYFLVKRRREPPVFSAEGCYLFPLEEGFREPWFPESVCSSTVIILSFDVVGEDLGLDAR